ncbi:citramalate synthase [Nitrospirillum pindoramense]|uniref:Citramalate synthase n=1 Tax=Nitrospirillum amazonense TaxID=28077 RepID=A0A560H2D0_9PROT|nr:citramalate synthase [Nitrospirillum amazonense]TWB40465.1 2-isopropylmalate synthase [Nitrospirillum amazonense]
MTDRPRIHLYDTTLRDGAQTQGVDFTAADKAAIARELDALGIDYIEGGWPGANPTDDAFFADPPVLKRARLTAFGMTRRPGRSAGNDPGLNALFNATDRVPGAGVCLVGKTWDFHVDVALNIPRGENLDLIRDSVAETAARGREPLFDAEHFFDGYKANPDYALACVRAAYEGGARWIVLCDTNGGSLPHEVEAIVAAVARIIPGDRLGIHCHNDTENAVANSLAAVRAGARMIQGTLNGLGERCGNANLISLIPTLALKMGYDTGVDEEGMRRLVHVSRLLDDRLNRAPNRHAAYVGESAFAHKGGLHVSAVEKDPTSYEHVPPESVGNRRHVVVSDQAGRSNVLARLREVGIAIEPNDPRVGALVEAVKRREFEGYAYDGAEASFELLARRTLGTLPDYFRLISFRVLDERRWNAKGDLVTLSEATAKLEVPGVADALMTVAEGNGPVNALDTALRKALIPAYPHLDGMRLVDYKVRILTPQDGTKAVTRVMIETRMPDGAPWVTVGVSANVIDASFNALFDSITYCLYRAGATVPAA